MRNPVLESVVQLKKQEFCADLVIDYEWSKKELGEKFDGMMKEIEEEVEGLRVTSSKDISFAAAGMVMCFPTPSDEVELDDGEMLEEYRVREEHAHRHIRACIAWRILKDS